MFEKSFSIPFFLNQSINPTQRINYNIEDIGVASPIWNREIFGWILIM